MLTRNDTLKAEDSHKVKEKPHNLDLELVTCGFLVCLYQ